MRKTDGWRDDIILQTTLLDEPLTLHATWGLFSPEAIDEGSELLLKTLPANIHGHVLDLGCGYGAIGLAIAKKFPRATVHLIDKDFVAVDYAKKNAALNNLKNTKTYLSNGFSAVPETQFDLIVSNLPAKVSKEFFWILLEDANRYLKPEGQLMIVTISGLKSFIKRNMMEVFGNYTKMKQSQRYTVARATK